MENHDILLINHVIKHVINHEPQLTWLYHELSFALFCYLAKLTHQRPQEDQVPHDATETARVDAPGHPAMQVRARLPCGTCCFLLVWVIIQK